MVPGAAFALAKVGVGGYDSIALASKDEDYNSQLQLPHGTTKRKQPRGVVNFFRRYLHVERAQCEGPLSMSHKLEEDADT